MVATLRKLLAVRAWKKTASDLLLNEETNELQRWNMWGELPSGPWLLKRTLTLPESTQPLYLAIRIKGFHGLTDNRSHYSTTQ
ncbi:hypothetical protein [Candidatus Nitrospira bockiana]